MCHSDSTFGPFVSGCRNDYDFTILFEEVVMFIVPSVCFIILAAVRLRTLLLKSPTKLPGTGGSILRFGKLVSNLRSC